MRKPKNLETFQKKFSDIFSDREVYTKKFHEWDCILSDPFNKKKGPVNGSYEQYARYVRETYDLLDRAVYSSVMRAIWLERRFGHNDNPPGCGMPMEWRKAHGDFLLGVVGVVKGFAFPKSKTLFDALRKFAEDFHPGFYELLDPRKAPFEFPFPHLSLAHVAIVADMDEGFEMLYYAEHKEMGITAFLDFLANWTACHNQKYGEKYRIIEGVNDLPATVVNLMTENGKTKATGMRMALPKSRVSTPSIPHTFSL